jgi:hypothetical protein
MGVQGGPIAAGFGRVSRRIAAGHQQPVGWLLRDVPIQGLGRPGTAILQSYIFGNQGVNF